MLTNREPRHQIPDPQERGCLSTGSGGPTPEPGDEFDRFLRLTGGPAAPRGGHMDSVKGHEGRVAVPVEVIEAEHYYGQASIIVPVYKPRSFEEMHPELQPAVMVTQKSK